MSISGLTHAASAPALLRFAFRVATHAQGWLPAGWLAFTGRESNPLDHCERFQIIRSSSSPVLLVASSLGKIIELTGRIAMSGMPACGPRPTPRGRGGTSPLTEVHR